MEFKKRNIVIAGMSIIVMTVSGLGLAFQLGSSHNERRVVCESHK